MYSKASRGERLEKNFLEAFLNELHKDYRSPCMEVFHAKKEHDKLNGVDYVVKMRDGSRILIDVTTRTPEEKKCVKVFPSKKFGWKVKHYLTTTTTALVVQIGREGVSPKSLLEWLGKRFTEGKLVPPAI